MPDRPPGPDALHGVPPDRIGEIVEGRVVTSPRLTSFAARVAAAVAGSVGGSDALDPFDEAGGDWRIVEEPVLHLGGHVLVPELAGWRRSRVVAATGSTASDVVPDWVGEVVVPATEGLDRVRKLRTYHREGVGTVWLISPLWRVLEVLVRRPDGWEVWGHVTGPRRAKAPPFDLVVDLSRWWG